jgi:hypothetical protein
MNSNQNLYRRNGCLLVRTLVLLLPNRLPCGLFFKINNMGKIPKTKYFKETNVVFNHCEIRIDKTTKQVKYTHTLMPVICSDERYYVVKGQYGLELIDKPKKYSRTYKTMNKVSVAEQRWGISSMPDYLYSRCISTFSEKVTKDRIKKALYKYIQEEAYFYTGLESEIEFQLSNKKEKV